MRHGDGDATHDVSTAAVHVFFLIRARDNATTCATARERETVTGRVAEPAYLAPGLLRAQGPLINLEAFAAGFIRINCAVLMTRYEITFLPVLVTDGMIKSAVRRRKTRAQDV